MATLRQPTAQNANKLQESKSIVLNAGDTAETVLREMRSEFPSHKLESSPNTQLIHRLRTEIGRLRSIIKASKSVPSSSSGKGHNKAAIDKDKERLRHLELLNLKYYEVIRRDGEETSGKISVSGSIKMVEPAINDTCCICLDNDGDPSDFTCICDVLMKSQSRHAKMHRACIKSYVCSTISQGYIGMCPQILCPNIDHGTVNRPIIPYSKWSTLVDEKEKQKYQTLAECHMLFLCGNCHNSRSQLLPFDESLVKNRSTLLSKFILDVAKRDTFISKLADFQIGQIHVTEFYSTVFSEFVPEMKLKEDKEVWEFAKLMIAMVPDPERRATLQLRHFRDRPRFLTLCCQREHCFNCKTKDFHVGKSCSENINGMDSSYLPCPNCNLFLAKSDGCDSVTCPCAHKFSWTPTLTLYKNSQLFSTEFPKDTAAKASDFLCGLLDEVAVEKREKLIENVIHWRSFNKTLVDRMVISAWKKRFPYAANQMIAKCEIDSSFQVKLRVHNSVVQNWNTLNKAKVDLAMKQINASTEALVEVMYPTISDKFAAVTALSQLALQDRSKDDTVILKQLMKFKNANAATWSAISEDHCLKSVNQFLQVYGSSSCATNYNRECTKATTLEGIMDHFWHKTWCNSSLEMTEANLCVKRPGGNSSYPAAFCMIKSTVDVFRVRLEEAGSNTNSMSFGVSTLDSNGIPSLSTQGSDGVGRTSNTYGIIEDRGTNIPLRAYCDRTQLVDFRKLRVGDVMTAIIDTIASTLQLSLNDEFTHTMNLPSGHKYCFAMTFANDHRCRILNDFDVFETSSVDVFPQAAAVVDTSRPSTPGTHSGTLSCNCGHRTTGERFPLNSSRYHLTGVCRWSCCNSSWDHTGVCQSATQPPTTAPTPPKAGLSKQKKAAASKAQPEPSIAATVVPERFLNASHSRMFGNYVMLLKAINKYKSLDDVKPQMRTFINSWASQGVKGKVVDLDEVQSWVNILASKDKDKSLMPSQESWKSLLSTVCVCLVEKAALLRQKEEAEHALDDIKALQFLEMHGQADVSFIAAACLLPSSAMPEEDKKMAQAFMRVMPDMLQEWYIYNSSLSESMLPELQNVPKTCRCLPRCLKTCSKK